MTSENCPKDQMIKRLPRAFLNCKALRRHKASFPTQSATQQGQMQRWLAARGRRGDSTRPEEKTVFGSNDSSACRKENAGRWCRESSAFTGPRDPGLSPWGKDSAAGGAAPGGDAKSAGARPWPGTRLISSALPVTAKALKGCSRPFKLTQNSGIP